MRDGEREIRLIAFVQKSPGIAPNQRFRHEQWAPYLQRDHGIHLHFVPFESQALTRILYERGQGARKLMLSARDAMRRWRGRYDALGYDGVVVLREAMLLGGPWLERFVARRGVPLIFDFDDAIWQLRQDGRGVLKSLVRMPWKTGTICRVSSAVTVGNAYLAEYARRYASEVHVVRTSIDDTRFTPQPAPRDDAAFTVVWTGSHSTLPHLDALREPLERLAQRRRVRLRVICDVAPAPIAGVELDFQRWRAEHEAEDLAPGHVGVMPLADTPFTRGKCGCKALQYMAIGRPAVVSPVGINREIVEHGVNGMLASTAEEWEHCLDVLAADHELRRRMGANARETVLRGYTAAASAAAFARVVRTVVGRRATDDAESSGGAA